MSPHTPREHERLLASGARRVATMLVVTLGLGIVGGALSAPPALAITSASPIHLHWNADGTTADDSASFTGSWSGVEQYAPGASGAAGDSAFSFSGFNSLTFDASPQFGTRPVEISYKVKAPAQTAYVVGARRYCDNPPEGWWNSILTDTSVDTEWGGSEYHGVTGTSGATALDGTWHAVTLRHDAYGFDTLLDGTLVSHTDTGQVAINPSAFLTLAPSFCPRQTLYGDVDDLRIDTLKPSVRTQPTTSYAGAGTSAGFSVATNDPDADVQWQVDPTGAGDWTDISGATSSTYSFTASAGEVDGPQRWRAALTNGDGTTASDAVGVTSPIDTDPVDQTVASGATATFTAALNHVGAWASAGPQWWESTDGGSSFQPIAGATGDSFTTGAVTTAMSGRQFRASYTNPADQTVTTTAATLTVDPAAPSVTEAPAAQSVASGTPATFTAAATGDPAPSAQWQVSTDGGSTFTDLPGETGTSLTLTPTYTDAGNLYRAVFSNAGGTVATSGALLSVSATGPTVTADPTAQTTTSGQQATFTVGTAGDPAPTIQWQVSTDAGASFTDLPGATSSALTFTTTYADSGHLYRAVLTSPGGTTDSQSALLTVIRPTVPAQKTPTLKVSATTVTQGQVLTLSGTGSPGVTLRLYRALPHQAATLLKSVTVAANGTWTYRAVVMRTATYQARTTTGLTSTATQVVAKDKLTLRAPTRVAKRLYDLKGTAAPFATVKVYCLGKHGLYAFLGTAKANAAGAWTFRQQFTVTKVYTIKAVTVPLPGNLATTVQIRASIY